MSAHYYPPPPDSQPPPQNPDTYFAPPPAARASTSPMPGQAYYPPPPTAGPPRTDSSSGPLSPRTPYASNYQSEPPTEDYAARSFSTPPPAAGHTGESQANGGSSETQQPPLYQSMGRASLISSKQKPSPAPSAPVFTGAGAGAAGDDVGTFNGGSYRISHRDSNTIVTVQLAAGCPLQVKPGAMIAMSPTITLKGALKFSVKKLLIGGEMATSTFTGPGELLLAPECLGDVTALRLTGAPAAAAPSTKEKDEGTSGGMGSKPLPPGTWNIGKDAFLACTTGIQKDYRSQGITRGIFSGEGLFTYRMSGTGLVFMKSLGAIIRKDLAQNEKYIVDNGHLVAWNAGYVLERAASGGILGGISSGEGLVCKFQGPGTVFLQTRNPTAFAEWIGAVGKLGGG
ncbi:MAG: hypothetical protein M1828_005651 [Chrysothrix sp. TS-e1954]|nr:MAG: hypothetical protein M1828_005651 [Chrysothrix sp. TS-e1954]